MTYSGTVKGKLPWPIVAPTDMVYFAEPWQTPGDLFAQHLHFKDGLIMEFGVARGGFMRRLETHWTGKIYGFDSFEGLPEDSGSHWAKGMYAVPDWQDIKYQPHIELVVGLFADTLGGFLAAHPGPVGYAHIDSDIYSSAKCVLDHLAPRLEIGSILHFDEIKCYGGCEDEMRAFEEYMTDTGSEWKILGQFTPYDGVFKRVC